MAIYHDVIKEIKEKKLTDFIEFQINDKKVSLQIIDSSDETAELCLEWRNMYWQGYDTKFKGSMQRTKKWIKEQILNNTERIAFMILIDGEKIGHFGITDFSEEDNSVWFENGIRGIRKELPGLMEQSV